MLPMRLESGNHGSDMKIKIYRVYSLFTTHDDFDRADPSRMCYILCKLHEVVVT